MSIGEELYKKAYSDYANLDGNLLTMTDTTYRDDFSYYGYFDSDWCYTYSSTTTTAASYFTPEVAVNSGSHQCNGSGTGGLTTTGAWSGNFLNWATMTRMDIIRKVLFGGYRAIDTASQTILQRVYLPNDVHSFVKIYPNLNGDINKFTPYTTAMSFCSTSTDLDSNAGYPVMKFATGSFPQWASDAIRQCQVSGGNSPTALTDTVAVRTEACVAGKDGDSSGRCRQYGSSPLKKPAGLLQRYGEDKAVKFSLTTGTYKAHLNGGVLRKKASFMAGNTNSAQDEINLTDGTFTGNNGIIRNINSFKIATWSFTGAVYNDCNTYSIPISTVTAVNNASNTGTRCRDWGNPLAEIYLEALRYITGAQTPTTAFNVDDSTADGNYPGITGLSAESTWDDPWTEWCAQCSAIVISTGSNMFDGDNLDPAATLSGNAPLPGITGSADILAKTNTVGNLENGGSFDGNYYAGGNVVDTAAPPNAVDRYCKSMHLTGLSQFFGICPELPALEGTYNIAGLAYYAHTTDLRPALTASHNSSRAASQASSQGSSNASVIEHTLTTYAVDMAESVPSLSFNVDGKTVSLVPFCESQRGGQGYQGCTLIEVQVNSLNLDANSRPVSGSFTFYWEDSLWGNDHDLDVSQKIDFCIGAACPTPIASDRIKLITTLPSAAAGNNLRLSYSIYGVGHVYGLAANNGGFNLAPSTRTRDTAFDAAFTGGLFAPYLFCEGGCFYNNVNAGDGLKSGNSTLEFQAVTSSPVVTLKKPLWYAAKYGGFKDTNANNQPDVVSEWDADNDGTPDNFFSVKNPSLLERSLETVFLSILRRNGSASAVSTSSTRLNGDSFVYQAMFESGGWTGELRAYQPDSTTGALPSAATYKTSDTGRMPQSSANRHVIFYYSDDTVGASLANGSPKETRDLSWSNLHSSQQAKLALPSDVAGTDQKRVDWLLGNATYENNFTGLRKRVLYDATTNTEVRNILGDIVNSSPAYLGGTDFKYDNLTVGGSDYKAYVSTKRAATFTPLVFVGANDGMLHAFIANADASHTADILTEKFAYIPNLIFGKLANLTKPDYGSSTLNPHQYMVDGSLAVGDVYGHFSSDSSSNPSWHSIAVGSLGAGGKGLYALDVTNPSSPKVIFEYTNSSMGYVLGKIFIAPTADGRWVAVFGNGDLTNTTSKLFMVDIFNPFTATTIMDAGAGAGLSSPAILLDGYGQLKDVYAGDVSGNMWHFKVSDASSSNWTSYKVFATNTGQPITAAPTIGANAILKKDMVYFGTGRYYMLGDNSYGSVQQSFYAVPDRGAASLAVTRSDLIPKIMTTIYDPNGISASRTIAERNPDWNTQLGWYIDLDNNSVAERDERVTTKALLIQDKLLITTLIPNTKSCDSGGKSWLMEVVAVGDKFPGTHILDNPATFSNELFSELNLSLGKQGASNTSNGNSSAASSGSTSSTPNQCGASGSVNLKLVRSGTSGTGLDSHDGSKCAVDLGRQSWRQLK